MTISIPPTKEKDRRAGMTTEQKCNLARLAVITNRYKTSNERMARGLQIGFRNLENLERADSDVTPEAIQLAFEKGRRAKP